MPSGMPWLAPSESERGLKKQNGPEDPFDSTGARLM
jgi:hypothetical protein